MIKETKPTVFVVDDDAAVRDSLRMLLKSVGLPVEVFESGQEFLDAERDDRPGCLVLDIRMPGMSGLELQGKLNERHSILPIIFITGHGDVQMAVRAVQSGAFDFVEKPFSDNALVDRVVEALGRSEQALARLREREVLRRHLADLTERELEVMRLVTAGRANKQIADALDISVRTVEVHRARVFDKMDVKSAVELANVLRGAGLD